jgi:integrase
VPASTQQLTGERQVQSTPFPAFQRVTLARLIRADVPAVDHARPVRALRDTAGELQILYRMILGYAAGIRGKRVSPHTLRHTFAVNWLKNGGDTLSLQRLLGHSTPAMTTRYVNFATADLAELHRTVSPLDRLQADSGQMRRAQPERRERLL